VPGRIYLLDVNSLEQSKFFIEFAISLGVQVKEMKLSILREFKSFGYDIPYHK